MATKTTKKSLKVKEEQKFTNIEPSFYEIVNSISYNISLLKKYDSFGSTALAGVLSLLLSRSEEYVKQYNQSLTQNNVQECKIPDSIKEDVDSIINKVKKNLE